MHLRYLQRRYQQLETKAIELMKQHASMAEDLELVDTVPGFAETAAMQVLAEVGVLSDDLQPQQWVAQAGLDPKPDESGTSVHSPRHISKQGNAKLRAALFFPSMSACRCDPNVQAFYEKLLARGTGLVSAHACMPLNGPGHTRDSAHEFALWSAGPVDAPGFAAPDVVRWEQTRI